MDVQASFYFNNALYLADTFLYCISFMISDLSIKCFQHLKVKRKAQYIFKQIK